MAVDAAVTKNLYSKYAAAAG